MFQTREQNKTSEKGEMEIRDLPDKRFKIITIKRVT